MPNEPSKRGADEPPSAPERERLVLEARARALARPPAAREPASLVELTLFRWGRERYAIESRFLREVVRVRHLTPVPGFAEPLVGITNLRGEMLAVFDLRAMIGAETRGLVDLVWLLVLGGDDAEFGLLVGAVEENRRVDAREILPLPLGMTVRELARGATRDGILVVDGGRLLVDSRLFLEEPE